LRSSKNLKTIGVSINAGLAFLDRFLPDYDSYHFRVEDGDETQEEFKDPMSVVLRSDRTSLAYIRTLCDILEENRRDIHFIDDPDDFPIPPGSLMENYQLGQMSVGDLHGFAVSGVQRLERIGFLHKTMGWKPRLTWGSICGHHTSEDEATAIASMDRTMTSKALMF